MRDDFERRLERLGSKVVLHATQSERLPNTTCLSLTAGASSLVAERLASEGILVGLGAACSSGSISPPKALLVMGIDYNIAQNCLRISSSYETTEADYAALFAALTKWL